MRLFRVTALLITWGIALVAVTKSGGHRTPLRKDDIPKCRKR
jgi:hypothetical protein